MEKLIDNLNTVKLQQIFENEDFAKLQEAISEQNGESLVESLPVRSALAIFSFSWWSLKFIGEFHFIKTGFFTSVRVAVLIRSIYHIPKIRQTKPEKLKKA